MAALAKAAARSYKLAFHDNRDPRSDDWPLMGSVWVPLGLTAVYIYFVTSLGPRLMRDRKPMQLTGLIKTYNVAQILLNVWIVERCITLGWGHKYRWFCEPVDYSTTPEAYQVLRGVYLYFLVKLLDLADTVFFVLRKKDRQISFLHLYHHWGIFFGSWVFVKFLPGGHGTFLGLLNGVVHIAMYAYYFLTLVWPQRLLWWKKHLTQMQLAQFLVVIVHAAVALVLPDCPYPRVISGLMVVHYSFMFVLFLDFYRKTYRRKNVD